MYRVGVGVARTWSSWRAFGAATVVAVGASLAGLLYSAMLGFGVNERCTSNACATGDCPPCDRLTDYAIGHAVAQAAVALVSMVAVLAVVHRARGRRAVVFGTVVVLVWVALAAAAVLVYTDAAWDWANKPM